MRKNNVTEPVQPGEFQDQLTEILRQGARNLVLQAVEAEFASFLQSHEHEALEDGRKRIVRHSHLPERKVITGIGAIRVKVPRSRDRKVAEHWKHIRTTNPIESTFATVRHRTKRSKGCLSRETALVMVFKLIKTGEKTWRRLDGKNQLPKVITVVKFDDGCKVIVNDAIAA